MAMPAPPTAYDRAATIFSPEGDLYQVRYAFEAVKKGWTSVGIRSRAGVVLGAEKRRLSALLDVGDIEKIYKVDDHIGVAFAGMGGDGRILIDYARIVAVRHRLTYGEQPSVDYLAKAVADIKQYYTQVGGVRPFGVALIFGGVNVDGSPKLIRTDPGGQYFSYRAVAIGMNEGYVTSMFEKEYREDLSIDDMVKLVIKALYRSKKAGEEGKAEESMKRFHDLVEIGYIEVEERFFKKMSSEEISKYVSEIQGELEG